MTTVERTGPGTTGAARSAPMGELDQEEAEPEACHDPGLHPAGEAPEADRSAGGDGGGGLPPLPGGGYVEPETESEEQAAAEAAHAVDGQARHDQQEKDAGADDEEGRFGEPPPPQIALGPGDRLVQCPPPVNSAPVAMITQTVSVSPR